MFDLQWLATFLLAGVGALGRAVFAVRGRQIRIGMIT